MRELGGLGLNHKCESGPRKVCILPSWAPKSHDDENSHRFLPKKSFNFIPTLKIPINSHKKVSISYQHDQVVQSLASDTAGAEDLQYDTPYFASSNQHFTFVGSLPFVSKKKEKW